MSLDALSSKSTGVSRIGLVVVQAGLWLCPSGPDGVLRRQVFMPSDHFAMESRPVRRRHHASTRGDPSPLAQGWTASRGDTVGYE